ncbi:MAG TPA: hypothetical protein VJW20_09480 [Candidatus Angelobacter sp.]|nr:hypothetical protein [Candidatus Angelobacter sp.]
MKTVPEVVALLREKIKWGIEHGFDADAIGNVRLRQLLLMEDCLNAIGFPAETANRARVSLVPYIFQEANYDGLNWTDQQDDLDHLSTYFELDFMVQNQGKERREATSQEYEHYVDQSLKFIDMKKGER